MTQLKLCADCRWILPSEYADDARCGHPRAAQREQDLITGGAVREYQSRCWLFRMLPSANTCGPDGDLFEPKDSIRSSSSCAGRSLSGTRLSFWLLGLFSWPLEPGFNALD